MCHPSFATRETRIFDEDHLGQQLEHLNNVFHRNGYNDAHIKKTIWKARNEDAQGK